MFADLRFTAERAQILAEQALLLQRARQLGRRSPVARALPGSTHSARSLFTRSRRVRSRLQ